MHVAVALDLDPQRHRVAYTHAQRLRFGTDPEASDGAGKAGGATPVGQRQNFDDQWLATHHQALTAPEDRLVEHAEGIKQAAPATALRDRAFYRQRLDGMSAGACREQRHPAQGGNVEGDAVDHLPLLRQALGDEQVLHPETGKAGDFRKADIPRVEAVAQIESDHHLLPHVGGLAVGHRPHEDHLLHRLLPAFSRGSPGPTAAAYDLDIDGCRRQCLARQLDAGRADAETSHLATVQRVNKLALEGDAAVDQIRNR